MSFDAEWLDLRAPADTAARDAGLLAAARAYLMRYADPLVLDLGAGTGASVAAFGACSARWRFADHDASLLTIAGARVPLADLVISDLSHLDPELFEGVQLVTTSAFLDLTGPAWLDDLSRNLERTGAALYAALSYDGRMSFMPEHADDAAVTEAFNRHQTTDKGLGGAALGPSAAHRLADDLRSRGYTVRLAASPWHIGPGKLLDCLLDGIADAASELGVDTVPWRQARTATAGAIVGHLDLFAAR